METNKVTVSTMDEMDGSKGGIVTVKNAAIVVGGLGASALIYWGIKKIFFEEKTVAPVVAAPVAPAPEVVAVVVVDPSKTPTAFVGVIDNYVMPTIPAEFKGVVQTALNPIRELLKKPNPPMAEFMTAIQETVPLVMNLRAVMEPVARSIDVMTRTNRMADKLGEHFKPMDQRVAEKMAELNNPAGQKVNLAELAAAPLEAALVGESKKTGHGRHSGQHEAK